MNLTIWSIVYFNIKSNQSCMLSKYKCKQWNLIYYNDHWYLSQIKHTIIPVVAWLVFECCIRISEMKELTPKMHRSFSSYSHLFYSYALYATVIAVYHRWKGTTHISAKQLNHKSLFVAPRKHWLPTASLCLCRSAWSGNY